MRLMIDWVSIQQEGRLGQGKCMWIKEGEIEDIRTSDENACTSSSMSTSSYDLSMQLE